MASFGLPGVPFSKEASKLIMLMAESREESIARYTNPISTMKFIVRFDIYLDPHMEGSDVDRVVCDFTERKLLPIFMPSGWKVVGLDGSTLGPEPILYSTVENYFSGYGYTLEKLPDILLKSTHYYRSASISIPKWLWFKMSDFSSTPNNDGRNEPGGPEIYYRNGNFWYELEDICGKTINLSSTPWVDLNDNEKHPVIYQDTIVTYNGEGFDFTRPHNPSFVPETP